MSDEVLLKVRNLTWRPPDAEAPLFEGVDLEVPFGAVIGLAGPSGSGKSTLLRCLVGLEPRDAGEIRWRGEPVSGDDFRRFRRDVVYVHQEPVEIAPTVGENLAFARRMAGEGERAGLDEARQRELLERLGVGRLDWSREFGALSVGERQRVALVRSLSMQPTALLLDEPTASLDRDAVGQVEALLADFRAEAPDERTLVWIGHDVDQLERVADRIVELERLFAGETDGDGAS